MQSQGSKIELHLIQDQSDEKKSHVGTIRKTILERGGLREIALR